MDLVLKHLQFWKFNSTILYCIQILCSKIKNCELLKMSYLELLAITISTQCSNFIFLFKRMLHLYFTIRSRLNTMLHARRLCCNLNNYYVLIYLCEITHLNLAIKCNADYFLPMLLPFFSYDMRMIASSGTLCALHTLLIMSIECKHA